MIQFISSVVKYSIFAVIVLVASHLIEFKNASLSDHVLNAVLWTKSEGRISAESISSYSSSAIRNMKEDADSISKKDKEELNRLLRKNK